MAFRIAYCWHDVAVQLGFTTDQLAAISSNQSTRQHPVADCCKDMFSLWKRKNKTVTTEKLIAAIEEGADNAAFAAELSKGKWGGGHYLNVLGSGLEILKLHPMLL